MKFFEDTFADVIDWHIQHRYSAEMSKKSEVVSNVITCGDKRHNNSLKISLLMKNKNKYNEMIDVMSTLHEICTCVQTDTSESRLGSSQEPTKETLHQLLFGGDQLTAACARDCQELRINSDTATGRLQGPVADNWRTSLAPLMVSILFGIMLHACMYSTSLVVSFTI